MSLRFSWPAFGRGCLATLPFLPVLAAFAVVFGIAATEAGFNLPEILGFSFIVLAGTAQFAAVQMMQDNTPSFIVVVTALAVNLRMAMYSAALAPHFGRTGRGLRALIAYFLFDQPYALSAQRFEADPPPSRGEKLGFYFGSAVTAALPWWVFTWVGATAGGAIPEAFALDFAVPITFLAMVAPLLRSPAHVGAALVSAAAALALAFVPWNLGLLIAAVLAMITGAQIEARLARRRPA